MYMALPPIKQSNWPAKDRELWELAQASGDMLEPDGRASQYAPATKVRVEYYYGVWLNWLSLQGALDPDLLPHQRVTPERIKAFIKDYSPGRAPLTVAGAVGEVWNFLRCVHTPEYPRWLYQLAKRLKRDGNPARAKAPRMSTVKELLELGFALFSDGQTMQRDGQLHAGAVNMRNGLMIMMLITRPLRRKTFAAMRLGHTVHIEAHNVRADFPASDLKGKRPFAFKFPDWLRPYIEIYLNSARPVLLQRRGECETQDTGWFWLNNNGGKVLTWTLTPLIPRLVRERLGRSTNMHLFRDCAATEIVVHDPQHAAIVKDILHHASLQTSQTYYIQARSIIAAQTLADLVDTIREEKPR